MATSQIGLNNFDYFGDAAPVAEEPHKAPAVPKLFWAGALLFGVNVLITGAVCYSPELRVNMYGEVKEHRAVYTKPSPFMETVVLKTSKKVKEAEHLSPVLTSAVPDVSGGILTSLALPLVAPGQTN